MADHVNKYFNYFPYRKDIVLDQLKEMGWYPKIDPPVFKHNGQTLTELRLNISTGYQLEVVNSNAEGTVYFSTNGTDTRKKGGDVASGLKHVK